MKCEVLFWKGGSGNIFSKSNPSLLLILRKLSRPIRLKSSIGILTWNADVSSPACYIHVELMWVSVCENWGIISSNWSMISVRSRRNLSRWINSRVQKHSISYQSEYICSISHFKIFTVIVTIVSVGSLKSQSLGEMKKKTVLL